MPANRAAASGTAADDGDWWARCSSIVLIVPLVYLSFARHGTGAGYRLTSVAVLPFKPLAPQNRDEALEFGIADILIRRLATLHDVSVR